MDKVELPRLTPLQRRVIDAAGVDAADDPGDDVREWARINGAVHLKVLTRRASDPRRAPHGCRDHPGFIVPGAAFRSLRSPLAAFPAAFDCAESHPRRVAREGSFRVSRSRPEGGDLARLAEHLIDVAGM
jgi:hypothetical protein